MSRPKFSIRMLLILTAIVGCGLTFATQTGGWLIAFLVTLLLTNFACVVVAIFWYVLIPLFDRAE